jgi:polyribonucleotide nucleotidyltransferase
MKQRTFTLPVGQKNLVATFSDLAGQADGSVLISLGDTVVLVTAVMGETRASQPYFPLSVEFEERHYASGQILGSRFVRREGKPSDNATLSGRIIDRTIRPLFDHRLRTDVQVVATVLGMGEDAPDMLGVIGASLALATSSIPWAGPIGAVRIGETEAGELLLFPTYAEREEGKLRAEYSVCGTGETINMIETAAHEVSTEQVMAALEAAATHLTTLVAFQEEIVREIGKAKQAVTLAEADPRLTELFATEWQNRLTQTLFSGRPGKTHLYELKTAWSEAVAAALPDCTSDPEAYFESALNDALHQGVIERGERPDGRDADTIRPLFAQAGGVSNALHGSGIFYRGETHIFTALTLGGPGDSQVIDTIEESDTKKRFLHHYNFPPFSVGETGRVGGFNRRMIGHGALAEKALVPVIPPQESFPYTIRLVSETMSSNGSSSMGSVCASTLALMDGGVPITRPVAGIASGLMMENSERYVLLTDIQGPEDEHGDMDFKVAGTAVGVTAIQMDVKVRGVTLTILREALAKAEVARLRILDTLTEAIAAPRPDISPRAPKIITLSVLPEQIGLVIGSGGKTINGIREDTGVDDITIEDDGTVYITGRAGSAEAARDRIQSLTRIFAVGDMIENATVTRIAPFGAFVRLSDTTEGLLHISEIVPWRLESLDGVLTIGDTVTVSVTKVEDGKVGVSLKKVDPEWGSRRGLSKPTTP